MTLSLYIYILPGNCVLILPRLFFYIWQKWSFFFYKCTVRISMFSQKITHNLCRFIISGLAWVQWVLWKKSTQKHSPVLGEHGKLIVCCQFDEKMTNDIVHRIKDRADRKQLETAEEAKEEKKTFKKSPWVYFSNMKIFAENVESCKFHSDNFMFNELTNMPQPKYLPHYFPILEQHHK